MDTNDFKLPEIPDPPTIKIKKSVIEPEKKKEENIDYSRYSTYIFIDVPNLIGPSSDKINISLHSINWEVLMTFLTYHQGIRLNIKKAYAYLMFRTERQEIALLSDIEKAGLEHRISPKDIDPKLITEMFLSISFEKEKKVFLILLAGDGDYKDAISGLKQKAAENGASLKIKIFSWINSLSWQLRQEADFIELIDGPIHKCIDPFGHASTEWLNKQ